MMRRVAAMLLLLALAVAGCGAALRVAGTTPTMLNDGTCARPIGGYATSPMWVMALTPMRLDSLWRNPGDPFAFAWTVPAGTYVVTVWAKNAAGPSCSTSIALTATSRPAAPTITP
jgi:hypothetical protein